MILRCGSALMTQSLALCYNRSTVLHENGMENRSVLRRYTTSKAGLAIKTADVYLQSEHKLSISSIDQDAYRIIVRLQRGGYEAYLVGGAVRDLVIGIMPKDYDIVTSAEPAQIKRLFRNSRIIGKRFRLVHVFFTDNKIIEVSTFRSSESAGFNNVYGTIEEDVWRRDFSINGLFFDPVKAQLLDFVKGYPDLMARRLKPIIALKRIFVEDPVRMIRAVKYAVSTGCSMGFFLKNKINRSRQLLADISPSRLSEEAFKIVQGGRSAAIVTMLESFGLFEFVMPRFSQLIQTRQGFKARFFASLERLDTVVKSYPETPRFILFAWFLSDYMFAYSSFYEQKRWSFAEVYQELKDVLKPVTPPNLEVERAMVFLIKHKKLYLEHGFLPLSVAKPSMHGADDSLPGLSQKRRERGHAKPATAAVLNAASTAQAPSRLAGDTLANGEQQSKLAGSIPKKRQRGGRGGRNRARPQTPKTD